MGLGLGTLVLMIVSMMGEDNIKGDNNMEASISYIDDTINNGHHLRRERLNVRDLNGYPWGRVI